MNNTSTSRQFLAGCWIEEKKFDNGNSILKLSILPDKFIESLKAAEKNEKGYVKLVISARRELGKNNETHTIYVDDWKPNKGAAAPAPTIKPAHKAKKVATAEQEDMF